MAVSQGDAKTEVTDVFYKSRSLALSGKLAEALSALGAVDDSQLSRTDLGLKYFTLGVWAKDLEQYNEAIEYFKKSLQLNSVQAVYAHFYLGEVYVKKNQVKDARFHLDLALGLKPSSSIRYEIRFLLSGLDMGEKKWKAAYDHLSYLERKWRYTHRHPEVLWRMVQVEQERDRNTRACNWARKLYSKHPDHPLVYDWTYQLELAKVNGKIIGCSARTSDLKSRIRRLQLSGNSDRARKEIDSLIQKSKPKDKFIYDEILAQFYIQEGYVEEAFQVLTPYFQAQQKNFDYLMLLAKAASRAGHYQDAVGIYYKAYEQRPKSQAGRKALFSAAFLSYQFQDYDGASRKFEQFIKLYKKSGLSRDAQWHLAWIRYLRGDYDGAVGAFSELLVLREKNRRRWSKYPEEKVKYWLAMSHLRLEQFSESRKLFAEVAADRGLSFYSMASFYRLKVLPASHQLPGLTRLADLPNVRVPASVEPVATTAVVAPESAVSEEAESEELLALDGDEESKEDSEEENGDSLMDESWLKTDVASSLASEPKFTQYMERAQQQIRAGHFDLARLELYSIEVKTRNPAYLKMLMAAYEEMGYFNRSAYVSQIYFSNDRSRHGINGVRSIWRTAYPQAYEGFVKNYSSQFVVPKELVWSIMRAESFYREDVISPAGARGLMQVMPFTAEQVARLLGDETFNSRDLTKPVVNLRIGTRYLGRLMKKFQQQIPLVAASYNAGPHRTEQWLSKFGHLEMDEFIEHIPFVETRNYVKKVVRYYGIYNELYSRQPASLAWLSQHIPVKVSSRPPARETWESIQ
ncbi:MAG: transglycosylase SLT domain-containing protein [Bdellovibrionales bacterium]|nr:transglycosylase SLT domain-containing protein [Bdellovibrionales bacterium]